MWTIHPRTFLCCATMLLSASALCVAGDAQTLAETATQPLLSAAAADSPGASATGSSSSVTDLPDAPQSVASEQAASPDKQPKRILGIIPNFRSVSADVKLPPQSVKQKFITATQDSFDYSAILLPAATAGYDQARNNTPEFHQGA